MEGQGTTTSSSFRDLAGTPRDHAHPGNETPSRCRPSETCPPQASGHRVCGAFHETTLQALHPNAAKRGGKGARSHRGFHPGLSHAREKSGFHASAAPSNPRGMGTSLHLHAQEQQALPIQLGAVGSKQDGNSSGGSSAGSGSTPYRDRTRRKARQGGSALVDLGDSRKAGLASHSVPAAAASHSDRKASRLREDNRIYAVRDRVAA